MDNFLNKQLFSFPELIHLIILFIKVLKYDQKKILKYQKINSLRVI